MFLLCLTKPDKYCKAILTSSFLASNKARTLLITLLSVLLSGYDEGDCSHLCKGSPLGLACGLGGGPTEGCTVPHCATA